MLLPAGRYLITIPAQLHENGRAVEDTPTARPPLELANGHGDLLLECQTIDGEIQGLARLHRYHLTAFQIDLVNRDPSIRLIHP